MSVNHADGKKPCESPHTIPRHLASRHAHCLLILGLEIPVYDHSDLVYQIASRITMDPTQPGGQPTLRSPTPDPAREVTTPGAVHVTFRCPACRRFLETPARTVGRSIRCPVCDSTFVVPQPDAPPTDVIEVTPVVRVELPPF